MVQRKVVVISDAHLGYEKCDKDALNSFLDTLQKRPDVTDLVLLGDIVDMWRRDASGVFLENRDIVDKILDLPQSIHVHYVAGNHDFHVWYLKNFRYPLDFCLDLSIPDDQYTYQFNHGYEFEYNLKDGNRAMDVVMDALCRVMSDMQGGLENRLWGLITMAKDDINRLFKAEFAEFWKELEVRITTGHLQKGPEERLKDNMQEIEKRACEAQGGRPNEILIFGHTHHPFINRQENVVNTGSWVTDADVHNTYVELSGGKPRLFVFGGAEITERMDLTSK